MRRELAERLLAQLLGWTDAEKAAERAVLDAFAAYKFDEYQQFAPGRRFLESLTLWLRQFPRKDRRTAYDFVRNRLIFISNAEMAHLVELAFPFFVRPHLLRKAAQEAQIDPYRIKTVLASSAYRIQLRQTLVLGLSDGARTDEFRRANSKEISNEQIWHAYDISEAKSESLKKSLKKDLKALPLGELADNDGTFTTIVLLDDFTGSGRSYLRRKCDGTLEGKIPRIIDMVTDNKPLSTLIPKDGVTIIIVLYVAAPQAIDHIQPLLDQIKFEHGTITFCVVHKLSHDTKLTRSDDALILDLASRDELFDSSSDDEHGAIGGTSKRFGFAGCALPLVLGHNTPNNSIYLLWAEDGQRIHGLFPRVSRHRKFE